MNKKINIVTLNIPYPPDYGGMIDSYYRIKSLYDIGTEIHLHCFQYGRHISSELEALCRTVKYYPREIGFLKQLSCRPFIVNSRKSKTLLENLLENDYPIFFDGLHTTYYLSHPALVNRKTFVRLHNIEHKYYFTLARHESDIIKKFYYLIESIRLKQFESVLFRATRILPISGLEHDYFNNKYHNSVLLDPFHPFKQPEIKTGSGEYILYHGDLSVNENAEMSELLISKVLSKIDYPCIIAGKNPPERIKKTISLYPNITLIYNPTDEEIIKLIKDAHINLLPALNHNGLKIKLLYALFAGRHCLVNSVMVKGNHFSELCNIADTWKEMTEMISYLMMKQFTEEMIEQRRILFSKHCNNDSNVRSLISLIFRDSF